MPHGIQVRYRIVDVFSEQPLAGNALCVVLDPLPEPVMPAVAREVNLSETTFVTVTGDNSYDVRIFTPGSELPFAGHPSLGTAWVLGPGQWRQTSPGATVDVEADASGAVMTQPDPTFTEVWPKSAGAALGVEGLSAGFAAEVGGMRHLLLPTDQPVENLRPDAAALARVAREVRCQGVAVFRQVGDAQLHVRVFVPGAGIAEDPGTGSAAGPIGVLARRLWDLPIDLRIRQGDEMGRPCRIEVHAEPGKVRVGGKVAACAEGTFTL
ncbi:MAG: PhzF family phenazine biosynthesis protein [Acidimicrobiales bacterium]